jgi:EAL domain-containing protein (putative c-di-GMP-specific phosphodiesterase class I)
MVKSEKRGIMSCYIHSDSAGSGQIDNLTNLTNLIYSEALAQSAHWLKLGLSLRTAINFSVSSFSSPEFCQFLLDTASNDASSLTILEASIGVAKKLNMDSLAEGVETREDWELAERLVCNYIQGLYCAKPMRSEDLIDLMENWSGPH